MLTNNKMNRKNAFTLAEMLISLAVLSVIGSILISFINVILPDKGLAKFRKSYNTIHQTVQYLANDATIYPNGTFDVNDSGTAASSTYFCEKFADQISTSTTINCSSSAKATTKNADVYANAITSTFDGYCNDTKRKATGTDQFAFKTSDGIAWYGMYHDFQTNKTTDYMVICVDTNPDDSNDLAHIYSFGVRYDGKIAIGAKAQSDLYEEEE